MDIFFIAFVFLLIFMIIIMLLRLLRMEGAATIEPVAQQDYEARYQTLMEQIQILEDRVWHGAATRKMKMELETLQRQAEDLLTLLTPAILNETPQDYEPDSEYDFSSPPAFNRSDQRDSQICANCGSQVIAGDKFCANCGTQLQQCVRRDIF